MQITDEQKAMARQAALEAIQRLGGPVKAAVTLDVPEHRYQTIQSWLRTRVPAEWCPAIERATGGEFTCEQLRPDVEWEVLRTSRTSSALEA